MFNIFIAGQSYFGLKGGSLMREDEKPDLDGIYKMLEMISAKQDRLLDEIKDIKETQKKLHDEIKLSNFVLNNITLRTEILN